ncbi:unnamed protein product [Brassica oleracea var. botrytis]|uniref:(rape) hypothetical protein n=1 Tax=Brassica napus TaxID=3708 RepID=A0A078F7A8_BRANA|nr:unnamed protein product [Brassica napus]CDY07503.1 BnaC06g15610D [Brassica napus]
MSMAHILFPFSRERKHRRRDDGVHSHDHSVSPRPGVEIEPTDGIAQARAPAPPCTVRAIQEDGLKRKVLFELQPWDALVHQFKQEFCKLYGMTMESLLNIYLQAGFLYLDMTEIWF